MHAAQQRLVNGDDVECADPTGALAKNVGLSRAAFVARLSSEGTLRCQGRNLDGTRCKSGVAGRHSPLPVKEWNIAAEKGGYCRRHGGEPPLEDRRDRAAPRSAVAYADSANS